jgi:hypothetical protein
MPAQCLAAWHPGGDLQFGGCNFSWGLNCQQKNRIGSLLHSVNMDDDAITRQASELPEVLQRLAEVTQPGSLERASLVAHLQKLLERFKPETPTADQE